MQYCTNRGFKTLQPTKLPQSQLKWWVAIDDTDAGNDSILTYGEVQEKVHRFGIIHLFCESRNGRVLNAEYPAAIDATGTVNIALRNQHIPLYPNNQVDLATCKEVTDYWFTRQGKVVSVSDIDLDERVSLELRGILTDPHGVIPDSKQINSYRPIRVSRLFAINRRRDYLLAVSNTTNVKEWLIVKHPASRAVITADRARRTG